MLFVYGSLLPVRVMELVRHWKMQEKEHNTVILETAPELEDRYVQLLHSWEPVFSHTAHYANQWLEQRLSFPACLPSPVRYTTESLVDAALEQSRTYVDQLKQLIERTTSPDEPSPARTVMLHAIRESNYYIGLMSAYRQAANSPGRCRLADIRFLPFLILMTRLNRISMNKR